LSILLKIRTYYISNRDAWNTEATIAGYACAIILGANGCSAAKTNRRNRDSWEIP
jgi:hypothetical protein